MSQHSTEQKWVTVIVATESPLTREKRSKLSDAFVSLLQSLAGEDWDAGLIVFHDDKTTPGN